MMKIFIISAYGRCGSTWLGQALASGGDAVSHGEIFNSYTLDNRYAAGSLDQAVNLIEGVCKPQRVDMIKIFPNHTPWFFKILEHYSSAVAIHITRSNMLAQHSSQRIANKTDCYAWTNRVPPKTAARIHFNPHDAAFNINYIASIDHAIRLLMPTYRFYSAEYSEVYKNAHEIAENLGLRIDTNKIDMVKQNSTNILDRYCYEDHDEVREFIKNYKHPEWISETTDIPQK